MVRRQLKAGAVPSVFQWLAKKTQSAEKRASRAKVREDRTQAKPSDNAGSVANNCDELRVCDNVAGECEVIETAVSEVANNDALNVGASYTTCGTQTAITGAEPGSRSRLRLDCVKDNPIQLRALTRALEGGGILCPPPVFRK